jgi:tetraacyldisaccharide 4'-kinase
MRTANSWRAPLLPLGWGFGAVTGLRNRCYDAGLLREQEVGVPVVSVGNLVAGGTGKTPCVEYLTRHLLRVVPRLAVVSRGYGRQSRGVQVVSRGEGEPLNARLGGDEPVQMARKFPGLVVVVGEDRVAAARHAVKDLGAAAVILDDGYQHRALRRDCNLLLLDARRNIAEEAMLPAGNRREPRSGMGRADMVVFTKLPAGEQRVPWESELRRWFRGPVAYSRMVTDAVYRAADLRKAESLPGRSCFAFSGIADHQGFIAGLRSMGLEVGGERSYPDHHRYDEGDVERLARDLDRSGAELLITTEKDLMRLVTDDGMRRRAFQDLPLFYVGVDLLVFKGEEELLAMVDQTVRRSAA